MVGLESGNKGPPDPLSLFADPLDVFIFTAGPAATLESRFGPSCSGRGAGGTVDGEKRDESSTRVGFGDILYWAHGQATRHHAH